MNSQTTIDSHLCLSGRKNKRPRLRRARLNAARERFGVAEERNFSIFPQKGAHLRSRDDACNNIRCWRYFYTVHDRLGNIEDGEEHCARNKY